MARRGSGEFINHYNAVRMRVVGEGNLDLEFFSHDDVISQELVPIILLTQTNIQPTRLANFKQQRAMLEISVNEIDEWFRLNRLIIFSKPLATGYPG